MSDFDQQTPGQHRARYDELMAGARLARTSRTPLAATTMSRDRIIRRETVPGGWYATFVMRRGEALRLIDLHGGHGVSLLLWSVRDPSERLNVADTMKLQWTAAIGEGHLLMSDMGRVLAAIVAADAGVRCDLLAGGCTPGSNARKYGSAGLRNSADNFRLVASKHGLGVRDVPPCITVFADVRTDSEGRFVWAGAPPAGSAIDLRMEMDVIVGLSNCPHPLAPDARFAPGPIDAVVWQAPPPTVNDDCRTSGEEAMRAYENTDAWLAQVEARR